MTHNVKEDERPPDPLIEVKRALHRLTVAVERLPDGKSLLRCRLTVVIARPFVSWFGLTLAWGRFWRWGLRAAPGDPTQVFLGPLVVCLGR